MIDEILCILNGGDRQNEDKLKFAKGISANIMCAWEPNDPDVPRGRESFGQQRARRIAEGLLADIEEGRDDHVNLIRSLTEGNIDPSAIYRNLDSPKIRIGR